MNLLNSIQFISVSSIPLILAITLHEAAHSFVAKKCGDTTAFMLGRVTLNPVKHIDLFGTIILPVLSVIFFGLLFGWAKPVPVNFDQLKYPRRDMFLVAIAGPLSNLIMALMWASVASLSQTVLDGSPCELLITVMQFFYLSAQIGVWINCVFMLLNLIPIPPLDGSRIVSAILKPQISAIYKRIEPFGIWILVTLMLLGLLEHVLLPATFWAVDCIANFYHFAPIHPVIS